MKLYLSTTSPYSRLALIAALHSVHSPIATHSAVVVVHRCGQVRHPWRTQHDRTLGWAGRLQGYVQQRQRRCGWTVDMTDDATQASTHVGR